MVKPRRKEIKKIDSTKARNVCFCKRRKGLFKKFDELCRLDPDIYVSAIVFSPAGKPFVYGDTDLFSSLPSRHRMDEFNDILSVDISSLNVTELESHACELQRLRSLLSFEVNESRNINGVNIPEPGVNSEFVKFGSGSGSFGDDVGIFPDLGYDFESNINGSFFESGVNSDIASSSSRSDIVLGGDQGVDFETIVNKDYNIFMTNVDRNIDSMGFPGSEVNSEFLDFNSRSTAGREESPLMSGFGVNVGSRTEDFPISELDFQVMECDDFLNLSELEEDNVAGFGDDFLNLSELEEDNVVCFSDDFLNLSELEEDNVVGFGDDFEPGMDIGAEDEEIEAVLRDFINDADDNNNCISNVF